MLFTSESPVCPNAVKTVSDPIFQQTLRVNAKHDLCLLCEALLSHSLEFRPVFKRFRARFVKKKSLGSLTLLDSFLNTRPFKQLLKKDRE